MTRRNIAILMDYAPIAWTSQEDRHSQLCGKLVKHGAHPVLIFSEAIVPEIEARLRATGAEVAVINYGKGARQYLGQLRKIVKRYSVSAAHISFFDYFSAVPWIARMAGIRYIVFEMHNSGEYHATATWRRKLLQGRARLMTSPVMRLIAVSNFVKEQLIKCGVNKDQVEVRYLGVDTDRFIPDSAARAQLASQFNMAEDEIILSTVSYLRPFKNPEILVKVCKELETRKVKVRLFVAGGGAMLPGLEALSRQLKIEHKIHWLGNVSDPKTLLQASDVFVLASVGEAFGLVLAEAMACGVPIVGSRSGALPEVVADGHTGLLAPPLDVKAFADAIERLATDASLRQEMSRRARDRACEAFPIQRTVTETIRIYESLWGELC